MTYRQPYLPIVTMAILCLFLLPQDALCEAAYGITALEIDKQDPQELLIDPEGKWVAVANADCEEFGTTIIDAITLDFYTLDADTQVTSLAYHEGFEKLYAVSSMGVFIFRWDDTQQRFILHNNVPFEEGDPDCADDLLIISVTSSKINYARDELYLGKSTNDPNMQFQNFARLDLVTEEMREISIPDVPLIWGIEVDERNDLIYLTDWLNHRVLLLSAEELKRRGSINVGKSPYDIKMIDPTVPLLYVSNKEGESVSVIERRRVIKTFDVGLQPGRFMLDPAGDVAYLPAGRSGRPGIVTAIDTIRHRPRNEINVGRDPEGLALSPHSNMLAVCNRGDNTLALVDTDTYETRQLLKTGGLPFKIAFHPIYDKAFFSCVGGNTVNRLAVPPDPITSTLLAVPESIGMDGVSTSSITVTPRDNEGVLLGAGRHVEIFRTVGMLLDQVENLSDDYTQLLESVDETNRYSPFSVTSTVTSKVDGILLAEKPTVAFLRESHYPSIKILDPGWDFPPGGLWIEISGENFSSNATAYFDTIEAIEYGLRTDKVLNCRVPAHAPGLVDVMVAVPVTSKTAPIGPSGEQQNMPPQVLYAVAPDAFLYVDNEEITISCTEEAQGTPTLVIWKDKGRPMKVLRAENKDFTGTPVLFENATPPFEDPSEPPAYPGIFFYDVRH